MSFSRELPPTVIRRKQIWSTVFFLLVVGVFASLLGIFFRASPETPRTGRFQTVGDFPADHAWFNTSQPLSLYDQLRGHVTILFFEDFETLDDVRGLNRLGELNRVFPDDPIQVIVVYRTRPGSLQNLSGRIRAWDFAYPIIIDDMGEVELNFGVSNIPALLLIDSTARVSAWYYEGWEEADLEAVVRDLIGQGIASRTLAQDPFRADGGEFLPERFLPPPVDSN